MSGKGPLGEYVMRIPGIRYARGPYIQEKLILGEVYIPERGVMYGDLYLGRFTVTEVLIFS